ncbi:hypothetical protein KQI63_09495 [bacterium]|nr:hypothetical protein [bacterium]
MKTYIFSILLIVLTKPLFSASLHVPGDYPTIQEAIDACSIQGDTVLIDTGSYGEEILISAISIVIASRYLETEDTSWVRLTRLQGEDLFRPITILGNGETHLEIHGLTIENGTADNYSVPWGGGLYAKHTSILLNTCHFIGNTAYTGAAAFIDSSDVTVRHNVIYNNQSYINLFVFLAMHGEFEFSSNHFESNSGLPLRLYRGNGQVLNNQFLNNENTGESGGAWVDGGTWTIRDNVFMNNSAYFAGGLQLGPLDSAWVTQNVFHGNVANYDPDMLSGNGGACEILLSSYVEMKNNVFENNVAPIAGGIRIGGSNVILNRNRFIQNRGRVYGLLLINEVNSVPSSVIMQQNLISQNSSQPDLPGPYHWLGMIHCSGQSSLQISQSDFVENIGFIYEGHFAHLELQNNFWGDPTGPFNPTNNPDGQGDTLLVWLPTYVEPWSTEHFWAANVEPDTNLVDFGMVEQGETVSRTLLLTNTGVETLVVRGGLVLDPTFSLDLGADSLVLASDEQAEVTVQFHAADMDEHLDTLRFDCNDPEAFRETVELRANVTDALPDQPNRTDLPTRFELAPAQPNPFNPSTLIQLALPRSAPVRVEVLNLLGRRAALLHDGQLSPGYHRFTFDGTHHASGLYLIRATSPHFGTRLQKVMLLK